MASRNEPSLITSFKCISALPFSLVTLSRKPLRLRRTARRNASSVSKTVPKRNGRTVVRLKHSLTTCACWRRAFWPRSPVGIYSLTRTEKSPLGYANIWASAIPLRPSTGTGRRARIPPCTDCCSTMQYAYHAMRELLLSEKRLVGRRELFKNRAKFYSEELLFSAQRVFWSLRCILC